MFGKKEANEYMQKMRSGAFNFLHLPQYDNLEGHKRFAREVGYALNDFDDDGKKEILSASYSSIYVIGCALKPKLNAKEWIEILKTGIDMV